MQDISAFFFIFKPFIYKYLGGFPGPARGPFPRPIPKDAGRGRFFSQLGGGETRIML
jgi:hypothetical protein